MKTALVLFTRDLRVHDNPALAAAARESETVVPLFVLDPEILATFGAPNRAAFLLDSLADLDRSLTGLGARLVIRRGDVVEETTRIAAESEAGAVHLAEDVSAYAQRREGRLRSALAESRRELRTATGVTVVPPGDLAPVGTGGPYRVFTPYWNRWKLAALRSVLGAPERLAPAAGAVESDQLPLLGDLVPAPASPSLPRGGEREGRARLARWLDDGIAAYRTSAEDLTSSTTSGLSPYLHFGCVSALEVVEGARERPGGEAFIRQMCWRDFHHQLHAADPSISGRDLRPRGDRWRDDPEALERWQEGLTGYPIVDAAMRQLRSEGVMHNRARLVTASFLAKHLYLDWRQGAAHFARQLVDGDVANNTGNWQWVAGTGADTRPNRVFNPLRQARSLDPNGEYVRRWIPELAGIDGPAVHEPWHLPHATRGAYPLPIVDHDEAVSRFRAARGLEIG